MGKSNNSNDKIIKFYRKDNNLKSFLKEDQIQILEKINNYFINNFIVFLSNLIKKNVELVSYTLKIESYDFINNTIIKNIECFNLLEISPYEEKAFVIFYDHFLSVIVDLLFGGVGKHGNYNKKNKKITDTDFIFNEKIIKFITHFFSKIYHEYFFNDISFINKKIYYNSDIINFNSNFVFFIKNFNLKINDIEIVFDILIPQFIVQQINIKNHIVMNSDKNTIDCNKSNLSFKEIENIELNIIAKMKSFSISQDALYNLSEGDVLRIPKPDKIIGYIENQPIFFADHKRFNEQSIIFIEEFIHNNVELNREKEKVNE